MTGCTMSWKRRRFVQAALAAGAAPFFARSFAAEGTSPTALLRAPRRALVIGNGAYGAGALKNPPNDARAIADALQATGFEATVGLDWKRAEMLNAIREYAQSLAKARAVGVFYFAGHGVQLAWRNYLLPTDASIARMEDVQARCVDLNSVIEGISRAANPMNVVILDACRDNPFGRDFRVQQKGLSQVDAPPGTLLAYATSPGNVASDGEGANGLYTENLLREIRTPEAKIEDVFKRVRLAVRRRSNGLQVPWESTSLEEDFWFIPPAELRKLSEAEAEAEFKAEAEIWARAEGSSEPGPFEQYLQRYPSGRFSELAQARLDRALARQGEKKIEIASAPDNPYTKGTARADSAYKVDDRYLYHVMDLYSRHVTEKRRMRVTEVGEREVVFNNGGFVTDLLGNVLRTRSGRRYTASQYFPAELSLGKRWTTRYEETSGKGVEFKHDMSLKVTGRERITVPAGGFDCFRVEGRGVSHGPFGTAVIELAYWMSPRVRRPVARDEVRRGSRGGVRLAERLELAAFKQS